LVIGKITSLGSLFIIGAIAVLFLKQASATSFGHAGRDVGSGITGISTGISNLFGSFINPISGIFTSLTNLFNFNEQSAQATTSYGYVRDEPTPATSRINSATATQSTVNNIQSSSGTATTTSTGGYVNAVGVAGYLR
jgi:ABC-type cobalt transport system substrate-binding protein